MSKSNTLAIPGAPAAERLPVAVPLRDLAVAPENLRFAEPPDEGIAELADTLLAAGLLLPLSVRPGRRREAPVMVLDGRRRLLALQALLADDRIPETYAVSCFVETEPARQAAAVVLTNTAAPVHVADVIVAIGKMLTARLTPAAISAALGYGELEVRRLAALAGLHPKAIEALRAGKVSLRQARLLARLPDAQVQGELAEIALKGFGFQEWRVAEQLDLGQVSVRDRRFALVGPERYAAAGGRIESDLFGERADVVLDPDRLQAAWRTRAEALAQVLGEDGREIVVAVDAADLGDEDLEPFGYGYGMELDGEARATWRAVQAAAAEAEAALSDRDLADPACDGDIGAWLAARLAADLADAPDRTATRVCVFADGTTGLGLRAWGPPAPGPAAADIGDEDGDDGAIRPGADASGPAAIAGPRDPAPVATAPPAEVEGVGHGLHEVRTDMATRALIRALADDPQTALTALVARLFSALAARDGIGRGVAALTVRAEAYSRPPTPPIAALDGDVRRRLADRRAAWAATGLTPIAWVAGLEAEARGGLLAELVALSLDLREARTTEVRRAARAEAVEIAALCHADVTVHWTPDAGFLGAHPKARLLAMLDEMGDAEPGAAGCRKDELVALVAERAAARRWAPAYLSWAAEPPAETEGDDPPPEGPAAPGAALDGDEPPALTA